MSQQRTWVIVFRQFYWTENDDWSDDPSLARTFTPRQKYVFGFPIVGTWSLQQLAQKKAA